MKVLVTGASGLLGSAVTRVLLRRGHEVVAGVRSPDVEPPPAAEVRSLDVTDARTVRRVLDDAGPDAVVHCAGYTNVDGAESRPHEAMAVNADGTRTVALAALRADAALLYPSTDYVFEGRKEEPYRPGDPRRPVNAYGRSKKGGEDALRAVGGRWMIVRTSWLYGADGRDFVDVVLERAGAGEVLQVVDDQRGRPTWTGSLAPVLIELLEKAMADRGWLPMPPAGRGSPAGLSGRILHVADRGTATWLELARAIVRIADLPDRIEPVSTEEWGAPADRPRYSVLDTSAAEERLGRTLTEWRTSLERYLTSKVGTP